MFIICKRGQDGVYGEVYFLAAYILKYYITGASSTGRNASIYVFSAEVSSLWPILPLHICLAQAETIHQASTVFIYDPYVFSLCQFLVAPYSLFVSVLSIIAQAETIHQASIYI
jgi:hypothetical protein